MSGCQRTRANRGNWLFGYNKTFAPVAKITIVHCLFVIVAIKGWSLHQLNVNNAFLHSELDEEVYMQIPPGYCQQREKGKYVCRRNKLLYGLKQASRN